jgi:hypothetical protein
MLFFISLSLNACNSEIEPLDKIIDYKITVNPNNDGTLDMTYYLKWKVLDDGAEGLSWIVVGVANSYVSNIKALTNNIHDIYYTSDEGAQIRLDLDQTYYEGDVLELKFSFKQSRIFTLNGNKVEYAFIPGWFDEIEVERIRVYWKADNILYADTKTVDGWLLWEASLDYGESIECKVQYNRDAFPMLNPKEDYSSNTMTESDIWIIVIVISAIITIFIVVAIVNYDPYSSSRGFSGNISWYHYHFGRRHGYRRSGRIIEKPKIVSSGSGTSGRSCACACACACAGGGRAGCSRKDFTKALEI